MNWLDLVILAVLLVPALLGLAIGLIGAVTAIVGIIVGIVLASQLQDSLRPVVSTFFQDQTTARAVSFVLVLLVVALASMLLGAVLRRVLSLIMLGWVDKVAGLLVGLLIGALIVSALLFVMERVPAEGAQRAVEGSVLAGPFQRTVMPIVERLPGEILRRA